MADSVSDSLSMPRQAASTYPPASTAWLTVVLLSLLYMVSFLDRNLLSLVVADVQRDLRISDVEISILFGLAFSVSNAAGGIIFGWAVDRYSRRMSICIGLGIWSIATVACGFAQSFLTLLLPRTVVGAGEGAVVPAAQSMLPDLFPRHKMGLPTSIYTMGSKAGSGVSLLIGGLLTSIIVPAVTYDLGFGSWKGWQVIFMVAGFGSLLIVPLILAMPEPMRIGSVAGQRTRGSTYIDYWSFIRPRLGFFLSHHSGLVLVGAISGAISVWGPTFLARVHQWPPSKSGLFLGAAIALASLIATPIHALICDRMYARGQHDIHLKYLAITLLLGTPIGVLAFLVASPELFILLIFLFFTILAGMISLPTVVLQIIAPSDLRGKVASVQLIYVGILAGAGGPFLIAWLTESVLGDPAKIGVAHSLSIAVLLPAGAGLYWIANRNARGMIS